MPTFLSRLFRLLCAGVLLSVGGAVHAADAVELLRGFDDIRTMTASFDQTQTDERGEVVAGQSGRIVLARPGRFRWAYERPYEQLMVCDGEQIWLYDPDLAQVTVRPAAEALGGTPAALLAQQASLSQEFVPADLGRHNDLQGVQLKPKSADSDFSFIELWLRGQAPERMVFFDRLGNRTEVRFSQIRLNARVDESQLRFTPPRGVEVIESPGGAAPE